MARIHRVVQTITGGDNMQKKGMMLVGFTLIFVLVLTGCFKGEQSLEKIDVPEDAEAVDQSGSEDSMLDEDLDSEVEETTDESIIETVARQLYLIDVNGMVVEQTIELPQEDNKEVAKQVLTYLIKEGPVTSLLPNGFRAVLPAETEVLSLSLQEDGTLIVDVSEEFKNYEAEDELKILQAMTYTLTQFENIDQIELQINGYPQDEMPVNGTPIGEGYSREDGINVIDTDTIDLIDSQAVTIYYPTEYNDNRYYVPVTQHISKDDQEVFKPLVQALIDGPTYNLHVTHVFNEETLLMDPPRLENGVLQLEFNQNILKDVDKAIISDEVMETLVRTLTEQQEIKAVEVKVENVDQLNNENGEIYSEPVTKGEFMTVEKL